MDLNLTVQRHPDPWLDLLRPYVLDVVTTMARSGVRIQESWLDPRDPRDATIVCAGSGSGLVGLVWDEETGWRTGEFVDGRQGSRTVLRDVVHVGGGLLPSPAGLAQDLIKGDGQPQRSYRSHRDLRDGLDETLRSWPRL
ncbi:DUF6292 family protein [Actinoplanes sp. NPDC048967]|uniref:DUF6292 family protein n=1 Tax=Actinoplanes sp. NPDC048967 TaxID=3155269 RepID=UPI0033DA8F9E